MNKNEYVSNVDKDIYTVFNLPEEVIAVIFAYVSRSPKSFRDNLETIIKEEQLGQEKASKFHEKWVLNYGHASVAEHASVHVGIERVSRLFSSLLELSNEYLSFTEYSQRYQQPQRGDFYVPVELDKYPSLKKKYIDLNNFQYDTYLELNDALYESLIDEAILSGKEKENSTHYRKIAFEDARYALNLATFTSLGMTGNARALEDSLIKLLSSRYTEVRSRAEEIKHEIRHSVPTLVKYAQSSKYWRQLMDNFRKHVESDEQKSEIDYSRVLLLDWIEERAAINKLAEALIAKFSHMPYVATKVHNSRKPYSTVKQYVDELSIEEKKVLVEIAQYIGTHENPTDIFNLVQYQAEFCISEACWHQLLRHRKPTWVYKEPSVKYGVTIPPKIKKFGLTSVLRKSIKASEKLFDELEAHGLYSVAPYVVTNAHNRLVLGNIDLNNLYHLYRLRTSEAAQWEIKLVMKRLVDQISECHPFLMKLVKESANKEEKE